MLGVFGTFINENALLECKRKIVYIVYQFLKSLITNGLCVNNKISLFPDKQCKQ
nr:MAG TPA: hypothetical protein [Caudoviricetes sp.]